MADTDVRAVRRLPVVVKRTDSSAVFATIMEEHARNVRAGGAEYVRAVALTVYNRIRARTPVDEGALRTAWRYRANPARIRISNSKEYAGVVEFGGYRGVGPRTVAGNGGIYSRQAPRGMVRITVATFPQITARVAREVGFR